MAVKLIVEGKSESRTPVSVKGLKDGLLFVLDDQCDFDTLYQSLLDLLQGDSAGLFSGPAVAVFVDYGQRVLTPEQNRALISLFLQKDNFVLREWGRDTTARRTLYSNRRRGVQHTIFKGHVRAGQHLQFEGDVVIVGDVHPGGQVSATGDIFVFGRLLGLAHAGVEGNERAIVAAAEFAPLQLRIAGVIARTPEADGQSLGTFMEFAYLTEDGMAVDKIKFAPSLCAWGQP
ncbi:MAG: septation ring formation regulator EzrA [Alicyclobacillus sp.]|nr:septation ring formation regulator EzrA [Alicyclobacillus sp.]